MGYGLGEQLEPDMWKQLVWNPDRPWQVQKSMWRRYCKKAKVRRERRRAKLNPECQPWYRRFKGWEF